MLRGVLEAQAPPKQTATETIDRYSDRLSSATLLEDRRSAIQGLRSLAKEYPASVASNSLRPLISTLTNDSDDVETAQIVLETLLALFNPNADSPEASDEIALWLADEFSQRQGNIPVLLEYLEKGDRHTTLYALQLLSAISSARLERTQECILSAPLGTARLVAALDNPWEPIQGASLLLLTDITTSSFELQKIVAFENAFEKIFQLIQTEGGLYYGGILVQDCLSLLGNLLHLNHSNQILFRESGFISRIVELFQDGNREEKDTEPQPESPSKDRNIWGFLSVLRMFVEPGSSATQVNQVAFEKHGLLNLILDLAFNEDLSNPVRTEAFRTCSDIIRGNATLQERFAHNQVYIAAAHPQTNGDGPKTKNAKLQIYIIDALLDITLTPAPPSLFDLRLAACECIQAYFYGHGAIRLHFLQRAIDGHTAGGDETSNILSILLSGPQVSSQYDAHRLWFAALLATRLIADDADAKHLLMEVKEGDASKGEEVVTCIQTLVGNLMAFLQEGTDDRSCISYLMLLSIWCFDEAAAVDDLLIEGTAVRSLMQSVTKGKQNSDTVAGLCVTLLSILYEFSTKDSPLPRRKLQEVILGGLGRDQFIHRIRRLRQNPSVREFEILPHDSELLFEQTFVDFLKDNFSRLTRAIDRDPNFEAGSLHKGPVDRNLADECKRLEEELQESALELRKVRERETELDVDLKARSSALKSSQEHARELEEQLQNNVSHFRKAQERLSQLELNGQDSTAKLKIAQDKVTDLERQLRDSGTRHGEMQKAQVALQDSIWSHESKAKTAADTEQQLRATIEGHEKAQATAEAALAEKEKVVKKLEASAKEHAQAQSKKAKTETELKSRLEQSEKARGDALKSMETLEKRVKELEAQAKRAEKQGGGQDSIIADMKKKLADSQNELKEKEEARQSTQSELDDMLIVLGELEDKRAKDKVSLKLEITASRANPRHRNNSSPWGSKSLTRKKTETMRKSTKLSLRRQESRLIFVTMMSIDWRHRLYLYNIS